MTSVAAIIPAAGSGTRMQADRPKQYLELAGRPILVHTVAAFRSCPQIEAIVVVVPADRVQATADLLAGHGLRQGIEVIAGGRRRQDSVRAGLARLADDLDLVVVHDGARPLVSRSLIEACCAEALRSGAAIAAVPVSDTLKRQGENDFIQETVPRQGLWQAQTPQAARYELLAHAFAAAPEGEVTDEAALLESAGIPVRLVPGAETNIKITRPEDLVIAERLLMKSGSRIRIGHGFDAHRFAAGRRLVLGGVEIEHEQGLLGHSDADVVCHALCDAILGALGEGDIGSHFPDSSQEFKDISSLILLQRVCALMRTRGCALANADLTVVCQAPKLAPHIPAMRTALARSCGTLVERLNIKATTTEKMGYTGRQEGISCHAVVLLEASPEA